CYDYTTNPGIRLDYCNNITISGNNVSDVWAGGIYIRDGVNNTISGNILNGAGRPSTPLGGISIYDCDDTIISGNTITDCYRGIQIWHNSMYNTISGNTITNCDTSGINIEASNNNTISENIANENLLEGIYIFDSHYNIITGNTANDNAYGIKLESSNNNIVSGNILHRNDICIEETGCIGNILTDNDCGPSDGVNGFILVLIIGVISVVSSVSIFVIIKRRRIDKQAS
ncbi:MAG: nitrous oxide reductase family maturation protein NosD, partial [Candidatus Hodarchaeota archaeon]